MAEVIKDLEITIKPKITVNEETARVCLNLVEMFLNDNKEYNFIYERAEDGKRTLRLEHIKGRHIYE